MKRIKATRHLSGGKMFPAVVILLLLISSVLAQKDLPQPDKTQIDGGKIGGSDIEEILQNIAAEYHIPVAFISAQATLPYLISTPSYRGRGLYYGPPEKRITPKSGLLKDVLNNILGSKYAWTITEGGILVFPAAGSDPEIERFLDMPVKDSVLVFAREFEVVGSTSIQAPWSEVHFSAIPANRILVLETADSLKGKDVIEISVVGRNVRQLLDLVIRNTSFHFWRIFKDTEGNTKEFKIETR